MSDLPISSTIVINNERAWRVRLKKNGVAGDPEVFRVTVTPPGGAAANYDYPVAACITHGAAGSGDYTFSWFFDAVGKWTLLFQAISDDPAKPRWSKTHFVRCVTETTSP